jgi:starvation-inducible DNA-binding protein
MATNRKDTKVKKMFDTRIDLSQETRQEVVELLNHQLADTFDLFSQTKQAHWNVKGREFFQLHEMYDEFAEKLLEFVDMIAERGTALGGLATGTVQMAAKDTNLDDFPLDTVEDLETVRTLADRYAQVAASTRQAIDEAMEMDDEATADLFIEVSRELDKMLWFLEAHIQS